MPLASTGRASMDLTEIRFEMRGFFLKQRFNTSESSNNLSGSFLF